MSNRINHLTNILENMRNETYTAREGIHFFLDEFKKIEPLEEYENRKQRHYHFDYVGYLMDIKRKIRTNDLEELYLFLYHLLLEEMEYLLQKRFYVNLIDILENIE